MKRPYLIFFISFILSCKVCFRDDNKTTISEVDGINMVKNEELHFNLKFNGDYWFHPFKAQTTSNWNKDFFKSLKLKTTYMLFSCHTTVPPYYSSVGLYYDKGDSQTITELIGQLKRVQKVINFDSTTILNPRILTLSYCIRNQQTHIAVKYKDYFANTSKGLIRMIVWTIDDNEIKFEQECADIIKSLRF